MNCYLYLCQWLSPFLIDLVLKNELNIRCTCFHRIHKQQWNLLRSECLFSDDVVDDGFGLVFRDSCKLVTGGRALLNGERVGRDAFVEYFWVCPVLLGVY